MHSCAKQHAWLLLNFFPFPVGNPEHEHCRFCGQRGGRSKKFPIFCGSHIWKHPYPMLTYTYWCLPPLPFHFPLCHAVTLRKSDPSGIQSWFTSDFDLNQEQYYCSVFLQLPLVSFPDLGFVTLEGWFLNAVLPENRAEVLRRTAICQENLV